MDRLIAIACLLGSHVHDFAGDGPVLTWVLRRTSLDLARRRLESALGQTRSLAGAGERLLPAPKQSSTKRPNRAKELPFASS
jgi:hypothetical protein